MVNIRIMNWFEVDKQGLAKLLERKGKASAVFELIQNAWDQQVTNVRVSLLPVAGAPVCTLEVEDDDPDGFKDLSHAWTLFAESTKKDDATKRGRFNLGEKLVLALCSRAEIVSTTGGVVFDDGGRHRTTARRTAGSAFRGRIRMTRQEYLEASAGVYSLIPPEGIVTSFNGEILPPRNALLKFQVSLPTEVADGEGILRRTERVAEVAVYEPREGERSTLYELGIPVVEIDSKYHVDVRQKVPLNFERDGVTPAYLRRIRAELLNRTAALLTTEDLADDRWIRDAAGSDEVSAIAVGKVLDVRFGEKRVAYDPSDPEANKLAVSRGYVVVHGGAMSGEEWENAKAHDLILPAGQVTPSPKPYSDSGKLTDVVPPSEWSLEMVWAYAFARELAEKLIGKVPTVLFVRAGNNFSACYSPGELHFNLNGLPAAYFKDVKAGGEGRQRLVELLLHEFGHHYAKDHLSAEYHRALCTLGAKLWRMWETIQAAA
jgi:hypothetical protein